MASGTVTVTAKTGPALAVTAAALTNCTDVDFNLAREVLSINTNGQIREFDFAVVATVTFTLAAANGNATVTVSS